MVAIRPLYASASTDGDPISITATSTAGTAIHTVIAGQNHMEEVSIYANNISTSDVLLTMEVGGTAAGNQWIYNVPAQDGSHLVFHGRLDNGAAIAAFAATTAVINVVAVINRYIDPETAS